MARIEESKRGIVRSTKNEFGAVGNLNDMLLTVQNTVLDYRDVSLDQLMFMTRNDGQARGILNAIKNPIKMARAKIKEVEGGKAEAEFIQKNLLSPSAEGGMDIPLPKIIAGMATAVRDGYRIYEKVFKYENGKIWLKKLAYRSALNTTFDYDEHGNIKGATQKIYMGGEYKEIEFGLSKIAYFLYNDEENPYVGESGFYPVFYHYDKKHKLYAIAHLAYQLNAVPIRVGKHPPSMRGKDLESFRESLKSLGTSIAMTFPNTCEIDKFESDKRLTEFLYLLRHHDSMMSRAFLTQFMNLGQEGSGGSFALSSDQSGLFLLSLMSLLADIATVFNTQIIPQLIDWNFGTKKYPYIVFSPFSDAQRSAITKMLDSILSSRNPQVSSEFVLELEQAVAEELGLNLNYEEIKARIKEEREELSRMAIEEGDDEPEEVGVRDNKVGEPSTPDVTDQV